MKILFCIDDTEASEGALRFGALLAAGTPEQATLLGVAPQAAATAFPGESLRRAQRVLQSLGLIADIRWEPGPAVKCIAKAVLELESELVIVGASRKRHGGPSWAGGRIYRLIDEVAAPVLVVIDPPDSLGRILVGSGVLPSSDAAVQLAARLARGVGASVELVRVLPEAPAVYAPLFSRERELDQILASGDAVARSLRRQRKLIEEQEIACDIRLRYGGVVAELLAEMRRSEPGLIVLGSGHGWRRYLMGDVAREIVYQADRPVLVARPFPSRTGRSLAS